MTSETRRKLHRLSQRHYDLKRIALFAFLGLGCVFYFYTLYPVAQRVGEVERNPATPHSSSPKEKQRLEVIDFMKRRGYHTVAEVCEPGGECFLVRDGPVYVGDRFSVIRILPIKSLPDYSLTIAELEVPEELTWRNSDTSKWPMETLAVWSPYIQMMIVAGFVMESLDPHSTLPQPVLQIGLGGGKAASFMHALEMNLSIDVVEISPTMLAVARDWFGLKEDANLRSHVMDGVVFAREAAERGDLYLSILLDACINEKVPILCPHNVFMEDTVLADTAKILDPRGTLSVNIFTTQDRVRNEEKILALFQRHFTSCSLVEFKPDQRILLCSHRAAWTWREQWPRFRRSLEKYDDMFEFTRTRDMVVESL